MKKGLRNPIDDDILSFTYRGKTLDLSDIFGANFMEMAGLKYPNYNKLESFILKENKSIREAGKLFRDMVASDIDSVNEKKVNTALWYLDEVTLGLGGKEFSFRGFDFEVKYNGDQAIATCENTICDATHIIEIETTDKSDGVETIKTIGKSTYSFKKPEVTDEIEKRIKSDLTGAVDKIRDVNNVVWECRDYIQRLEEHTMSINKQIDRIQDNLKGYLDGFVKDIRVWRPEDKRLLSLADYLANGISNMCTLLRSLVSAFRYQVEETARSFNAILALFAEAGKMVLKEKRDLPKGKLGMPSDNSLEELVSSRS